MKFRSYVALITTTGLIALGIALGVDRAMAQGASAPGTPTPTTQTTPAPPEVKQPDPVKAEGSADQAKGTEAPDPAKNQSSASTNPGGPADPKTPAAGAQGKPWYEQLADRPIDEEGTFWMPKAVNKVALDSDGMFYAVYALSIFFFIAIASAVVYFVVKYRHRPGHKPEPSAAHNDALEVTWTVIPTLICVFLFYYGWRTYVHVVTPPQKAVEINVQAWRWNWEFTHQNGVKDSDLHVPVNTPVRLVMTSRDVLHAFYSPVMRVKQDIIPRRYTYAWFFAEKPGTYRLTCAEYCGTDHSQMGKTADGRRAVVVVHSSGGYEQYLADKQAAESSGPLDVLGAKLYEKKGCVSCHSVDGSTKIGPSFKDPGAWGKKFKIAVGGSEATMDESYIMESLMTPTAKAKGGFQVGTMPSFDGQLKPREIEALTAYIKSLKQ